MSGEEPFAMAREAFLRVLFESCRPLGALTGTGGSSSQLGCG
jgi:hypothetical protein